MTRLTTAFMFLVMVFRLSAGTNDSPWQRVVVIGASASSGFVLSEPFGGTNTDRCRLSYYLDAAITTPHEALRNYSSPILFMSPEAIASQEVEACTNQNPTLVVAVDFLFWFCYGEGRNDAERAKRFEFGLKQLERIPCPLIVGDIPDASSATNSKIINISQVPSETARIAANQRLREWAAARPGTTVVPLAEFMIAVRSNAAIDGQNISVPAGKTRVLLQKDQLHPSSAGAALLSLGILDHFVKTQNIPADSIDWQLESVQAHGLQAAMKAKPLLAK